jgi:O-acetyl-ADP-ribose deacetylase (regulator of RNase III)
MSITYIKGNLFETECLNIGHGCNSVGVMGRGAALEFKQRYPHVYWEYRKACFNGSLKPGSVHVSSEQNKILYNFITQPYPGPYAKIEYIKNSMTQAVLTYELKEIAIPKIGCGLGGLNWKDVETMLNTEFPSVIFHIYSLI